MVGGTDFGGGWYWVVAGLWCLVTLCFRLRFIENKDQKIEESGRIKKIQKNHGIFHGRGGTLGSDVPLQLIGVKIIKSC